MLQSPLAQKDTAARIASVPLRNRGCLQPRQGVAAFRPIHVEHVHSAVVISSHEAAAVPAELSERSMMHRLTGSASLSVTCEEVENLLMLVKTD